MLIFFWLGFLGKPQAKKSAVQTEFRRKGGGSGGFEQHFPYLGASLREAPCRRPSERWKGTRSPLAASKGKRQRCKWRQREGFCWIYGLPLFAQNWILLGSPF